MADVSLTVGHTASFTIEYDDQDGNPMLTTPTPDSPPTWTDAPNPPGSVTFTIAPDGNSASDAAVAAGTDVVSVSLTVGGVSFSAVSNVTVAAAPQVLTSIQIIPTVS